MSNVYKWKKAEKFSQMHVIKFYGSYRFPIFFLLNDNNWAFC